MEKGLLGNQKISLDLESCFNIQKKGKAFLRDNCKSHFKNSNLEITEAPFGILSRPHLQNHFQSYFWLLECKMDSGGVNCLASKSVKFLIARVTLVFLLQLEQLQRFLVTVLLRFKVTIGMFSRFVNLQAMARRKFFFAKVANVNFGGTILRFR